MRAILPDESNNTGHITDLYFVNLPRHHVHQIHIIRNFGQLDAVPEPRQPHQHVTVFLVHERRVYPQVLGDGVERPARREGLPGVVHPLEGEVPEVGLHQLLDVVAELHVEVAGEDAPLLLGHLCGAHREPVQVVEDVDGGLAEEEVGVVARHHLHAQAEVAVAREDVDGAAHPQLRLVLDVVSVGRESGQQHEQLRPAPHSRRD